MPPAPTASMPCRRGRPGWRSCWSTSPRPGARSSCRPRAVCAATPCCSLSLSADVTVTGKRTFTNLADVERPAENLVGIAQSASQGAITARQLDARPVMRTGEVLETVPGVVISQHSGEGKANQYYLRGFNLDHGTDFATTVAGMPVNMPTHGHGHGYSDLNFLIPELVSGVQFSKGPYFAEHGDFATAGAANINYMNSLDRPIVRLGGGGQGLRAGAGGGARRGWQRHAARRFEVQHNDGPWDRPDDYPQGERPGPLHPRRRAQRLLVHRHGLSRRPGTPPTRCRGAPWTTGLVDRFGTLDPTRRRRLLSLQRIVRVAAHAENAARA